MVFFHFHSKAVEQPRANRPYQIFLLYCFPIIIRQTSNFFIFAIGSSSNTAIITINRKSNQSSSNVTVPYDVTVLHFNLISSNKASDLGILINLVKLNIRKFNLYKMFDYILVTIFNKFIRINQM